MNSYIVPESLDTEIIELKNLISKYSNGEIKKANLKAYRVPFGVYEQRNDDTYMIRVRCAGGIINPWQLKKVAKISLKYGRSKIHLTTRQEVQIHDVKIENIIKIITELKAIGLSTKGGGGNTVRNIACQVNAGIDSEEVFDVTPYCTALTSRLISENDSWMLPRKYKIAFSGSNKDNANATVSDLGFIAKIQNGQKGFKVYIAGGMGAKSDTGKILYDFITDTEVYNIAKAIKNLFYKYGNRKNKHAARIRFLWKKLGENGFLKKYDEEYEEVKNQHYPELDIIEITNSSIVQNIMVDEISENENFELWKIRYVKKQKQDKLNSILIPVQLGFIDNKKTILLADFLNKFGDNVLRIDKTQNFLVRNIPEKYLTNFYNFLTNNFYNFNRPVILNRMISCAGASTCKIGICLSRNLADSIIKKLSKSEVNLDILNNIKINISGCPNSCGQHPISDLGFYGKALRKNEHLYPAYNIVAGADLNHKKSKLAEKYGEIAAYDIPNFLIDILTIYQNKKQKYQLFSEYIEKEGGNDIQNILKKYKDIPDFNENKNYYYDIGSDTIFSLADRGIGECSAGLFDLIDVDLQKIKNEKEFLYQTDKAEKKSEYLFNILLFSSRMLLITRGIEAKSEIEIYKYFKKDFIDSGLISNKYLNLINEVISSRKDNLVKNKSLILNLSDDVIKLYENMDDSLQFNNINQSNKKDSKTEKKDQIKLSKDFRGVTCPMNFVKTKIELAKLTTGDILEILLDDGEPINNVPGSVKSEGHEILNQSKVDDHWSVIIKKV